MAKRGDRTRLPEFLPLQHPRSVDKPPAGAGWLHEHKYDGYRMEVRVAAGRVTWWSREGHDWSARFVDLTVIAAALPDCMLDGELCILDEEGRPDFGALRSAVGRRQAGAITGQLVFIAFDLLWEAASDLRPRPLEARKARLADVLAPILGETFRLAPALPGGGSALLDAACALRLEGIVSKQLGSAYEGGEARRETWVKSKCRPSGEVIVGGWRTEHGRFRSLLSGVMEDGKLRYSGRIHTGFSAAKLAELTPKLRALEIDRSPFQTREIPRLTGVHWVRPELVARVTYAEMTRSGKLRQAAYHGLREDKSPEHVTAERPARPPEPVADRDATPSTPPGLDNPDKTLWPAAAGAAPVTKADLARYYEEISPWLLPYIRGRPCTVVVAPDGVTGPVTFVRHEGHWRGPLRTSPLITHWTVAAKAKTYPGFDTAEALVTAADIAVIEIHPWNSLPGDPMLPGRLVFDLDPEASHGFDEIVEAAFELKARLEGFGLSAFLKTTGQRGLHVVTPLLQDTASPTSWAAARTFARRVCEEMAADSPGLYTTALPKARRRGRIFLDYLRNDPGHHAVSLLSPRTAPTATVSMPVSWRAARGKLSNAAWTVRNAAKALKRRHPWAALDEAAAPLPRR